MRKSRDNFNIAALIFLPRHLSVISVIFSLLSIFSVRKIFSGLTSLNLSEIYFCSPQAFGRKHHRQPLHFHVQFPIKSSRPRPHDFDRRRNP